MNPAITQPQVDSSLKLLAEGYEVYETYFDLYGMSSLEFGVDVMDVTLHGDKRSLIQLFSAAQIQTMCDWCEREAERSREESAIDQRIGLREWHRAYDQHAA